MPFLADRPYNDLPPLPPAFDVETRPVLKACVEARAALAEARIACRLIPNPTILINLIPVLEAQASSEIENIVTTTDRLFRFDKQATDADPATKEALRYRTALRQGFEALAERPLSTRTAVDVCSTIKGVDMDIRAVPGTALRNEPTGRVVYTPPEGVDRLRDMLAAWERFIHEADHIDPLVRLALMHYQFEAIHPFTDGNGRTGRVLNLLFLVDQGLLDVPVLYLSRYIIEHRRDYYRLLLAVTVDGAWEDWILYMLRAVRDTAAWTVAKVEAVRRPDGLDRRNDAGARAENLFARAGRGDLRAALLSDRQPCRRGDRQAAGGIGVSADAGGGGVGGGNEDRSGEGVHQSGAVEVAQCRLVDGDTEYLTIEMRCKSAMSPIDCSGRRAGRCMLR